MHTFRRSEKKPDHKGRAYYEVGFMTDEGKFIYILEAGTMAAAANAVHFLNGGGDAKVPSCFDDRV